MTLQVRVVEVVHETAEAHSLVLEPLTEPFDYRPGQFLTIRIPTDRAEGAARCYSLSSSPVGDEKPKVTIKRTADGYGSNWICDNVVAGTVLEVLKPAGTFTPKSWDTDLLLFAGGSGITPVMSILKSSLYGGNSRVALVYANRDRASVIFDDELKALAAEFPQRLTVAHWLQSETGLPTKGDVITALEANPGSQTFICGPAPFMDLVASAARDAGIPADYLHVERFTSLHENPFEPAAVVLDTGVSTSTLQVTIDGESRELAWPRSNRLLDVLLAGGIEAPFSCREGACSACACVLLEGEVDLAHNDVLDAADLSDGLILACQALPRSDRLSVTFDV